MASVRKNARDGRYCQFFCSRLTHQHQCRCTIVNRRRRRGSDGAVFLESWFQRADFFRLGFQRTFIFRDDDIAALACDSHWCNFPVKRPGSRSGLRALYRGDGVGVLLLARELILGRAVFGIGAHGAAAIVGIFQTVEHHVVVNHAVPDAVAASRFGDQIRRVSHRLHTTGDDHAIGTCEQRVDAIDRGLHRRAAHLRQGHRTRRHRNTCLDRSLSCWRLPLPRHQAITKNHFIDDIRLDAAALERSADRDRTEISGGDRGEVALKRTHWRARRADNNNRVLHDDLLCSHRLCGWRTCALLMNKTNLLRVREDILNLPLEDARFLLPPIVGTQ